MYGRAKAEPPGMQADTPGGGIWERGTLANLWAPGRRASCIAGVPFRNVLFLHTNNGYGRFLFVGFPRRDDAGAQPPEKDPSMTVAAMLKQKPYNVVVVRPKDRIFEVVHGLARQKVGVAVVM